MSFGPGSASRDALVGGCKDITDVVMLAYTLTEIDFSVIETRRTPEKQRANMNKVPPVSWTMNSDHLYEDKDGTGVLAVDLYPWVDGKTSLSRDHCGLVAKAMFRAAGVLGVQIKWGGFWTGERYDGPHYAKRR